MIVSKRLFNSVKLWVRSIPRFGAVASIVLLGLMVSAPALAQDHDHEAHTEHAAEAHDGHGAHGDLTLGRIFTNPRYLATLITFAALISLLVLGYKKAGKPALVARRKLLEEKLNEAQAMKAAAEEVHAEYTARLAKMDEELQQIRTEMLEAGEVERKRIVAEAEARAASMRRDTDFQISQRMKQLREDLKLETVENAIAEAERLLENAAGPADQTRLADQYLETLSQVAADSGAKELS